MSDKGVVLVLQLGDEADTVTKKVFLHLSEPESVNRMLAIKAIELGRDFLARKGLPFK